MKRPLWIALIPLALMGIIGCKQPKEAADTLFYNGSIHLVDDSMTIAEALVISSGKVLASGTLEEMRKRFAPAVEVDLQGRHLYPGFIDAHCHFLGYARSLAWADLRNSESIPEMLNIVREQAKLYPEGWVLGRGWDQNRWPGKLMPTREALDSIFPNRPVMLSRVDGHAVLVNTFLLRLAGLENARDSRGGEIVMENGRPSGLLLETTADRVKDLIPEVTPSELAALLKVAESDCYAVGLSSVHDAGLHASEIRMLDSLKQRKELSMHIYAMLNPTPDNFIQFLYKGPYITERMIVRSVKLYADGALGSRGALLLDEYDDKPGHFGIPVLSFDSMKHVAGIAYEMGYQVNTHAIGDSAVRKVLDIYSALLREPNDFRWRIEHSQVVNPADLPKFTAFSVIPSVNAVHATSDMSWAAERLGNERVKHAYAYADLLECNAWLCNGSDFPVEQINPLHGFLAACLRQDISGQPAGGFQAENAISRAAALRAMTIWAARAAFDDEKHGSLENGKQADLVILDINLMMADAASIAGAKVWRTYIDGQQVFPKKPAEH
jgi:predicted amidohydrolase YtcJ